MSDKFPKYPVEVGEYVFKIDNDIINIKKCIKKYFDITTRLSLKLNIEEEPQFEPEPHKLGFKGVFLFSFSEVWVIILARKFQA